MEMTFSNRASPGHQAQTPTRRESDPLSAPAAAGRERWSAQSERTVIEGALGVVPSLRGVDSRRGGGGAGPCRHRATDALAASAWPPPLQQGGKSAIMLVARGPAAVSNLAHRPYIGAMKKIGFLSFGHWTPSPQSKVRTASDALLQSIELAVAAEELGADGAYFRVHHYARQLGSPFPLLAAVGARTKRIEIGTAVIDMRYENPLYMAEDAGAADIISGGRLQLGISRGSPEQVIDGWRYFGYAPAEGKTDADMARRHTEVFLDVLRGAGFCQAQSAADVSESAGPVAPRAVRGGPARAHLVGRGFKRHGRMGRQARHEPAKLDAGL